MKIEKSVAFVGLAAAIFVVACTRGAASEAEGDAAEPSTANAAASVADTCSVWTDYRRQIGDNSSKIRRDGDRVFVWAGGDETGPGAEWYEVTGTPLNVAELQYGFGADAMQSIDIPLFVPADDPRLMDLPLSTYRRCERPESPEEIMVIGYVAGGSARAYPTALLDRHEIVNEEADGKPFTVGW